MSYEGTCDGRKNFLPAPSPFPCAPASMLMPFVCVDSMGAVIKIAFFRESHSEFLHFYLQDKTGRESSFGECAGERLILPGEGEQK